MEYVHGQQMNAIESFQPLESNRKRGTVFYIDRYGCAASHDESSAKAVWTDRGQVTLIGHQASRKLMDH